MCIIKTTEQDRSAEAIGVAYGIGGKTRAVTETVHADAVLVAIAVGYKLLKATHDVAKIHFVCWRVGPAKLLTSSEAWCEDLESLCCQPVPRQLEITTKSCRWSPMQIHDSGMRYGGGLSLWGNQKSLQRDPLVGRPGDDRPFGQLVSAQSITVLSQPLLASCRYVDKNQISDTFGTPMVHKNLGSVLLA